ncbi:hypothetical protein BC941DRAFT_427283 [Chlamydoabsidia padenii]|nr:hypothetical protein BC941DRAFT_427283 [Chlamydoabsidia padenii]
MKNDLVYLILFFLFSICIHGYQQLSTASLNQLVKLSSPAALDYHNKSSLLAPLLVERVVGTPSHAQVRHYIIAHFERLGWNITLDRFTTSTPLGTKPFTNIIATQNPASKRKLVLAAHYDSMLSSEPFIGATDSAVPCALLLSLSDTLNDYFYQNDTSLELIFFDGEEAMVHWSDSDSIYGATHLAELWETEIINGRRRNDYNRLQTIDVLVLLDLMGTPNPTFHNYFRSTSWLFYRLADLESRLAGIDGWQHQGKVGQSLLPMFPTVTTRFTFDGNAMQDDHLPFKQRGVNILHLIPYPFPIEWHTPSDNADCLDPPTIRNLDLLFKAFTCEYLELDPLHSVV